jgi:HEPN domain-containing protein
MKDATREAVQQWIDKAQSDWQAVLILRAHSQVPRDTVCFHCQQHVEKLLKALLTLHSVEAPRTHNLRRLIQLAEAMAPELGLLKDRSDALTAHGVASRYPDDSWDVAEKDMKEAIDLTGEFRTILLSKLNV